MSSAADPTAPLNRATERGAWRSSFKSLGAGTLITSMFCVALLAAAAPALSSTPGSLLARLEPAIWVIATGLLGSIAACSRRIDEWFDSHRPSGFAVTAIVCGFAAWLALSPNLDARFGVVDDHEIISQIGPGRSRLQWREWSTRFANSEAFSFGAGGRYRPAYAGLHLAECCWWGREVQEWYLARIALCAAMLLFLARAASRGIGTTLALSAAVALLGTPGVADTFCRLGPAESYGMTALALGIWALDLACRENSAWMWWISTAGFALASMCKENFVPLAGIACVIGALALRHGRDRSRASPWIALFALAVHTAAMLFIIARMLMTKGHDIYSGQIDAGSFSLPITAGAVTLVFGSPLAALWPLLAWSLWAGRRRPREDTATARLLTKDACLFLVMALAAWFSQAAFYRDSGWPTGTRYDLPGILVPLALLVFASRHLLRVAAVETTNRIVVAALFTGLMLAGANGAIARVRTTAASNAAVTRHFASWVDKIAKTAVADPLLMIVLAPERPPDHYEPVISVAKFLRYKKVVNPITYTTLFLRESAGTDLEKSLFDEMKGGFKAPGPTLHEDPTIATGVLYVPFGVESATKLTAAGANVVPVPLDEALRKSPR